MATLEVAQASHSGVTLDEWVYAHGPLGASPALLVALDICVHANRLADSELTKVLGSLTTAAIVRDPSGRWSWLPARIQPASRKVRENDVLERVGAILFHALTGRQLAYPLPLEHALRTQLRAYRPDLPAAVADLTIDAVSAQRRSGVTFASFSRRVGQALGTERPLAAPRSHQARAALAASAVLAVLVVWAATRGAEQVESHGLTPRESVLLDVLTESTQSLAMMDEHTAAIQMYQQISRLWLSRVAAEDPRVAWNEAHHAWVRTLAGDRLTAEQSLENMPASLAESVGEHHPYTRASRLALAATLDARGASEQAAALRAQATRSAQQLLHDGTDSDVVDDDPVPPGLVAHVAPNAPEREGFRRMPDGSFGTPLTSVQYWIASHNGWRLHIVATGPCQTSFIAGADPRRIVVNTTRDADGPWRVRVEGANPAALEAPQGDTVHVSLTASGTDAVDVAVALRHSILARDPAAKRPVPPYTLTFRDAPGRPGCAVVWLEIPFPPETTFSRR